MEILSAGLSKRILSIFVVCATLIALSFFFRHIAGIAITHGAYNPLVYNPSDVRTVPAPHYDYLPDDVVWDEVRAYARTTQGFFRGEYGGPVIESYQPYVESQLPHRRTFFRDGLGQCLLSRMAMLLGSVPSAFLLADFLFVFLLTMSLLFFCWELKQSVVFAIAATSAILFFNWQDVLNLYFFLFRGALQNSSFVIRTPYPQLALVVFLGFLFLLKRAVEKPGAVVALGLAIAAALNFYTYFFSWPVVGMCFFATVILLAISPCMPVNAFHLDHATRRKALWTVLASGAVAMALSAPVWTVYLKKTPDVVDTFLRFEGVFTHRPNIKYTMLLLSLLVAVYVARRLGNEVHWIFVVLILAFLGVMNIQVISGRTIQPNHWSSYYVQPFLMLAVIHFLWRYVEKMNSRRIGFGVALLLAVGVGLNVHKFWIAARDSQAFQTRDAAFAQLTERLRATDVVDLGFVSNDYYISQILPAYVPIKPLEPSYMDPLSNQEIWQLRLAAAESAGFDDWNAYADASGRSMPLEMRVEPLRFWEDRVLLVMNKHRMIPRRALEGRCSILDNQDFLVLKPCPR